MQVNVPHGAQRLASIKSGDEMAFAVELEILTYVKSAVVSWLMRNVVVVESCTGNMRVSLEEAGHVHKKLC